jgi:O-antigen/teichoic acid export membrane protein
VRSGFRGILKDFAVYGTGEVLVRAFAFLTVPIYTRIFSVEDYGVLSFVLTVLGLVAAILILGGDSAYARHFFEAKTLEERRVLTGTWIGFLAAFAWIVTLAVLVPASGLVAGLSFGDGTWTWLVLVGFLTVPIGTVNAMFAVILRMEYRSTAYTVLNLTSISLNVGLGLAFVLALGMGLVGIVAGTAVAGAVMIGLRAWTVRDLLRPRFSRGLLRKLLAYGVPLVPTSLAFWVFLTSDRLVLGKLSDLQQLGWYSVAVSLSGLLGLANNALSSAWTPHGIRLYEEDPELASVQFGRVFTYVLAGMGFLCVGVTTFAPELMRLLSKPAYYPAAAAVGPLAFAMIAYTSIAITGAGISLKKQTKYLAVFAWVAAVANLVLNLLLDHQFGMMGAAWATTAAYVLLTLCYFVVAQRLWPVTYERRRAVTLLGLIVAFMLGAGFLPGGHIGLTVIVKGLYCGAFLAACFVLGALDGREVRMLRSFLSRGAPAAAPD